MVGIESGPIETQGRVILPVTFDDRNRKITLTASATHPELGEESAQRRSRRRLKS